LRQYHEARAALKQAVTLLSKNKIQDAELHAEILNSLGIIQFDEGEINKAEKSFTRAVSLPADPNRQDSALWEVENNLAQMYQLKRHGAKAEAAYKRALQLVEIQPGGNHPDAAMIHTGLGALYNNMGRLAEAEKELRQSLDILERTDRPFDDTV